MARQTGTYPVELGFLPDAFATPDVDHPGLLRAGERASAPYGDESVEFHECPATDCDQDGDIGTDLLGAGEPHAPAVRVVGAVDSRGGAWDPRGLDPVALLRAKRDAGTVAGAPGGEPGLTVTECLARRRHIGPFALERPDRPAREKQLAAFLRAGHDLETARTWVDAAPGEEPPRPEDA